MSIIRKVKSVVFGRFITGRPGFLKAVRLVQFFAWRAGVWVRKAIYSEDADGLIWVNPRHVDLYIGDLPWSRFGMRGRVVDGAWDESAEPFQGWDLYKAMQAHHLEGDEWQSTPFYARVAEEIREGAVKWGCATVEEFEDRLRQMDQIYDDIRANGYKSQRDLIAADGGRYRWELSSPFNAYDEVTVCIDRRGRILLRDGKHRLSIAKILDLDRIPVAVGLRHREWVEFKRSYSSWVASWGGAEEGHSAHPDLRGVGSAPSAELLAAIRELMPSDGARVLEAGTPLGLYCHCMEGDGYHMILWTDDEKHRAFAEQIRDALGAAFDVAGTDEIVEQPKRDVDILLIDMRFSLARTMCASSKIDRVMATVEASRVLVIDTAGADRNGAGGIHSTVLSRVAGKNTYRQTLNRGIGTTEVLTLYQRAGEEEKRGIVSQGRSDSVI